MKIIHSFRVKALAAGLMWSAFAPLASAAEPAPKVMELIESRCALCHGRAGDSVSPIYPRLAAQHPDYLSKQLKDFRDGRRKSDTMSEMAKDLSDENIAALAAWFSSRASTARRVGDTELAAVGKYIFVKGNNFSGVPSCASCHGANGAGTQHLPRLAGQHPGYLETQLKDFSQRERSNDNAVMHSVASKLTELEIRAVVTYIGGLQ